MGGRAEPGAIRKLSRQSLTFKLRTDEDGWPPVATECLPFTAHGSEFELLNPPLFVEKLSVGDRITIESQEDPLVLEWSHVSKSRHSTAWVIAYGETCIDEELAALRAAGCGTVRFSQMKLVAIDVPAEVSADVFDQSFQAFKPDQVAIAYPSWRH